MKSASLVATAVVGIALLGLAALPGRLEAQKPGPRQPALVISSLVGRDLFEFYCASCHGRDGRGGGPTAPALKEAPSDLTTIAARNGGIFPRSRVEAFVTGDSETAAHGSKDMPVWGPIFRWLDPGDAKRGEAINKVRIANIVDHIESMQQRP